jgi:hypothetical protein
MQVYHGSYTEIIRIDLIKSLSNKSTNLYQDTWQEIYDKLKHELPKIKQ